MFPSCFLIMTVTNLKALKKWPNEKKEEVKRSPFLSAGMRGDGVTRAMRPVSLPPQTFSSEAIMGQSHTPKSGVVDAVGSISPPYLN